MAERKSTRYLSVVAGVPLGMINNAIKQGKWPQFLKTEKVTPIPKVSNPRVLKDLRCISLLMSMSKIMEKLICPIVLQDMKKNISPSQYAGQKGLSTEHLLVKLLDNILKALDNNQDSKASQSHLKQSSAILS